VNQSVIQQNKNKTEEQKEEIQKKKKDTMFARYGVENMWHLPEFVEKLKTTNLNKYGVDWVQQDPTILAKRTLARHQNFIDILKDRFPNISPLIDVNQYTGINIHQGGSKYPWKCDICEHVFEDYISFSHSPMCPVCTPKDIQFNSSSELELYNFLKTFDLEFRMHEKQIIAPFELDFVFEQKKLAIEYCGLYWHSEKKVDKNYHKKKLKLCNEQGYRLITIFEDEWRNKKDIVQSRLQHALGLSNKSCGARQTNIKQITTKEYRSFLEQNHIQGFAGAKIKLGAFFNNQLVSVMSFGAYRKALGSSVKQDEYELIRFCSLGKIPGISSKLFKYFLQNYSPKKIISYCDLRWGTGTVYEKLGFELMRVTEPNYWYTRDGLNREHRFKYTKQNLIKLGFDPNQTELDIMSQLGYYKIWDCGHLLYIFKV
jgi:very-short-patch-repair endonuclease